MQNLESFFGDFPEIDLNSVKLRQISIQDSKDFYEYMTNKEVKRYLSNSEIPSDLQAAEIELMYWANLFNRKISIYWAIADKATNKIIGTCGFNSWSKEHKRVEISYDLSFKCWNQGIMTSIVRALTRFAFDNMGAVRVQATVVHFNAGSSRVLEKCGYKKEGVLKDFGILHGKSEDFYMYSCMQKVD